MEYITNFKNSNEYRKEIHNLIPGGAHTYSKGDDQFPELSPAAIKKGSGAYVWDIDDNKYLDCSMGLTSVGLGHAYPAITNAIKEELDNGVNFQRPSHLEKKMAEEFLSLLPGHDMIKFSKNGSTATTAAVKLCRAHTGRKMVAFPGDHPFYSYDDWFIGKTKCSKGVPEEITALSLTFTSTDLSTLEELFKKYPNQIACVISEPEKSHIDDADYIPNIIELCHKNGALFIMDEMVTGFKTAFPGTFSKSEVKPDLATWGKGIANGFSFCALTGTREIMNQGGILDEGSEKVFLISSTHGAETTAMAACLATINEFKTKDVIAHNHEIALSLSTQAKELVESKGLTNNIEVVASEWFPIFIFKDKKSEVSMGMRTLMLQEMIKRGILFQGVFVPCFSHTTKDIAFFMEAFNESLDIYANALESGYENFLIGEPTKPVFRKFL